MDWEASPAPRITRVPAVPITYLYMLDTINTCVDAIVSKNKTPLLVGITGDSGSGKSRFTGAIMQELESRNIDCLSIDADEFCISRADREPMKTQYYQSGPFV